MAAALGGGGHPGHVAVPALVEEICEPFADRRADGGRRRHPRDIEPGSARLGQHQLLQGCGHVFPVGLLVRW
jgi:hypothetical protein